MVGKSAFRVLDAPTSGLASTAAGSRAFCDFHLSRRIKLEYSPFRQILSSLKSSPIQCCVSFAVMKPFTRNLGNEEQ